MTTRVWHSGPPTEIGWWPASYAGDPESIRWWDGKDWSRSAYPNEAAVMAAYYARLKASNQTDIKWTERWWL